MQEANSVTAVTGRRDQPEVEPERQRVCAPHMEEAPRDEASRLH